MVEELRRYDSQKKNAAVSSGAALLLQRAWRRTRAALRDFLRTVRPVGPRTFREAMASSSIFELTVNCYLRYVTVCRKHRDRTPPTVEPFAHFQHRAR